MNKVKNWQDTKQVWLDRWPEINELVLEYLYHQEIPIDQVSDILKPSYEDDVIDWRSLPDVEVAAKRLIKAIDQNEKILVFADYDADGLPGAAIVDSFFKKINFKNYYLATPDRNREGFGLKINHVEKAINESVGLIITIDCGSASIEAIDYAARNNIAVVVTDHHEVPKDFNFDSVAALVNPMSPKSSYPFKNICGALVIFKLLQAVIHMGKSSEIKTFNNFPEGFEKWWLDLVAVATVGDMMPLRSENRVLVLYGLSVLNKTKNYGLRSLIDSARLTRGEISSTDIAFRIAPRLNAASRVGQADKALQLLAAADPLEANRLAAELETLNNNRKKILTQMIKVAHKKLGSSSEYKNNVVVVGDASWLPGMCGLLASRLVEEYGVCSFVWGRGDGSDIKGSCRADDKTDIYQLMNNTASGYFKSCGGHQGAGGFVLEFDHIHGLVDALESALPMSLIETKDSDEFYLEIDPNKINLELLKSFEQLEPFGKDFTAPRFKLSNITLDHVASFGANKEHMKLKFNNLSAIKWRTKLEDVGLDDYDGQSVNLFGSLEFDNYTKDVRLNLDQIEVV